VYTRKDLSPVRGAFNQTSNVAFETPQNRRLAQKLTPVVGRKELISNTYNFKDLGAVGKIPFGDHNMTMRTLHESRRSAWMESQMLRIKSVRKMNKDISRRHSLMDKYFNEQNVQFTEKDAAVLFSPRFTLPQAEMLVSRNMFNQRYDNAATLIQAVWRGSTTRSWYKDTMRIRTAAVNMIRRNYLLYRFLKIGPIMRKKK
jgi:hypothetical protein